MGVDEERRVKDVSRVSDLEDWRMCADSHQNRKRGVAKSKLGLNTQFEVHPTVDVLYAAEREIKNTKIFINIMEYYSAFKKKYLHTLNVDELKDAGRKRK